MNSLKKILSFLLICAMLMSTFVTVGALEAEPTITVASKDVYPGGNVDITIDISNNPGIISMLLDVDYDNTYLSLTKVTNGTTLKGATHDTTAVTSKPYTLSWADDTATENNTANGTIVTFSFSVANNAPVAAYPITVTYDNDNAAIYDKDMNLIDFAVVNGSINVIEVPKEDFTGITLSDKTYSYDGTEKSVSVSGTVPDGATVDYENNKATDAGEYKVKATVSKDGYNDLVLTSTLKIDPKPITLKGIAAQSKTYDGTPVATVSAGTLNGVVSGDDVSAIIPEEGIFASADAMDDVAVTIDEIVLEGADCENYILTQPTGLKADITPAPIYVKADDITLVKGSEIPELTYTITDGILYGDDEIAGSLTTDATGSKLGEFDIKQGTLAVSSNYKMTFSKGTLTVVDKTPQNIAVSEITTKTYGDEDFKVEVTADEESGLTDFEYESSNPDVAEIDADGNVIIKSAGVTDITVSQAGDDTYAPFTKTQQLVVNKVKLTITADAQSKIVGYEDPELTYTIDGELVNGDEIIGNLERESGEDVGAYDILIGSLEVNDNYDITYNKAVFEILDKLPQNITVSEITSKTYGDEGFKVEVTADEESGLTDFEYESSNPDVAEIDAEGNVTIKSAGATEITVAQAGDDTYASFTKTQKLVVNKAKVTITANPATKKIGTEDPELTYEISGSLVGEDVVTGSLVREEGEEIGNYGIRIGSLAINDNYDITYNGAIFAIVDKTPQNIVVGVLPEVTYGDAPFAIEVTPDEASGLAEFTYDSSNAQVATVSEDGTITIVGAGEAVISVSQAGNDDYAPYVNTQKLTVSKKDITVSSIDAENKIAILEGLLADSEVIVDFNKLALELLSTETETTSKVKFANFVLTGAASANYNVVTESLEVVVPTDILATVTVNADNGTVTGAGTYLKDTEVTLTAKGKSSKYKFQGWYAGEELISSSAEYTFVIADDVTLEAKFKKRSSSKASAGGSTTVAPTLYTVKFVTNGGSGVASQNVEKNGTVNAPSDPVKDGYIFAGWYRDINLKNKYDFTTKVTKSMMLYAAWEEVTKENVIVLTIGKTEATVFGETKTNDVAPKLVNDRTMLPARFVAESLGAEVIWTMEEANKVLIKKDNTEIIIYIGSDIAYVNGEEVKLDSPAFLENDRTYTPVRFVAESLGAKVEWKQNTQEVIIIK